MTTPPDLPAFFRPEALSTRWQISTKTLANLRSRGQGPAFVKINGGSVRYPLADVLAHEATNRTEAVSAA